jgi:hypothetical protein
MILRAGPPGDWRRGRRIVWIAPPPVLDTCHTFIDDDAAPVASIRNIVKRFGTVVAVDDVSSDVRRSEIRAFLACSCASIHSPKRGCAAPDVLIGTTYFGIALDVLALAACAILLFVLGAYRFSRWKCERSVSDSYAKCKIRARRETPMQTFRMSGMSHRTCRFARVHCPPTRTRR